ncbi:ion transporter [bacterium]|nr:ion transporter [bacterium]
MPIFDKTKLHGWRLTLHEVIYETNTRAGKIFDVALIVTIAISTILVMLDSVQSIHSQYGSLIRIFEWIITGLFTIEYITRIICVWRPLRYVFSFYGVIDLIAILPTYLRVLFPGGHYLMSVRALRILRVFRVMKLVLYMHKGEVILKALKASGRKIIVFVFAVLLIVFVVGSLMYLIEGEANGFTSIPRSVYWAIVTVTTVGYGDISPQTPLGQAVAAILMILGYSIIAVPTGIVGVEVAGAMRRSSRQSRICPSCKKSGHDEDAKYCKWCGDTLN